MSSVRCLKGSPLSFLRLRESGGLGAGVILQMIVEPELRIPDFAKAGADIISVHAEVASTIHLHRSVNMVRQSPPSDRQRLAALSFVHISSTVLVKHGPCTRVERR